MSGVKGPMKKGGKPTRKSSRVAALEMLKPLQVDGKPHWETTMPKEVHGAYSDFRNFLFLAWLTLDCPAPRRLSMR